MNQIIEITSTDEAVTILITPPGQRFLNAKNSLAPVLSITALSIHDNNGRAVFSSVPYANVTVNGTQLTKDNAKGILEDALFSGQSGSGGGPEGDANNWNQTDF